VKSIRRVRVDHPKGEINKLDLGSIVTEGANNVSTATTNVPTESTVKYDMEKYRSAFDLKTDFLEDNIQGASVRDLVLDMFSKRIAIDTELASLRGDQTLNVGDGQSAANNLYGTNDGFLTILTANVPAAQQIDCNDTDPSVKLFYDMKRAIPTKYRVATPNYVFLVSPGTHDKYMYDQQRFHTSGTAAQGFAGAFNSEVAVEAQNGRYRGPGPWGIPLFEVPLMPEDLGAGTDETKIILTPLDNLVYFIQRDITIEFDRRPRTDSFECTIHFRVDFQVEQPDMCVVANEVGVGKGTDYTG
jgi:hypothetical protein